MKARKTDPQSGKKPTKSLVISETLHSSLKEKAKNEGRVLSAMVEEKLEELVPPQLELIATEAAR